jgi:hypothetical protein
VIKEWGISCVSADASWIWFGLEKRLIAACVTHQAGDEVLITACHHSHRLSLLQQAVYPVRVLLYVDKSLFFRWPQILS